MPTSAGRPKKADSQARQREMLRLMIEEGAAPHDAARRAHVKPATALRLLDRDDYFTVYAAIREGRVAAVAVVLEPGERKKAA